MMTYLRKTINLGHLLIIPLIILVSGCSSVMHEKKWAKFNHLYSAGEYLSAANIAVKNKGKKKSNPSKLLASLQAAASLRYAQKYSESSLLFDECEETIKHHNEQLLVAGVASNMGKVLLNDAMLDYRGAEYDGIMVNTYKALNFWQIGQRDSARVEFNRALDRQRRAKTRFAKEIAKTKAELEKKQQEEDRKALNKNTPKMDIDKNVNNPEISHILRNRYPNLHEFKAYPDFINPFTTYIAGLFFMSEGNYSKAATLLKEVYGMVERNTTVVDDFARVEKILDGQKNNKKYTWVIFENGLGPEKEEFRIDLPILLFTDKVKYTGIALPKLKMREQAYSHLIIKSNDHTVGETSVLASMDRVVQTEFKKKYTAVVTRAIVSALAKTYAQYLAQREFGDFGGFAVAAYQGVTTSADIRIWTALPKEFQVARIATPSNGIVLLETPMGEQINVIVPKNSSSLIYIKIPKTGTNVVYDVITM